MQNYTACDRLQSGGFEVRNNIATLLSRPADGKLQRERFHESRALPRDLNSLVPRPREGGVWVRDYDISQERRKDF